MRVRVPLTLVGAVMLGYGGWLVVAGASWTPQYLVSLVAWFGIGPVAHDLLVAPAVAVIGLLVARSLPPPWRSVVAAGLVTTAAVTLVAIPVLTRPHPAPPNPGLDDRGYLPGLLTFLGVVWALLLAGTVLRVARRRRRGRGPDGRPHHHANMD